MGNPDTASTVNGSAQALPASEIPEPDLWFKRITYIDIGPFGPEPFVIDGAPTVIISGDIRLGKTTCLKGLTAPFDHNPQLIREGCAQGKIIYEYTDGSSQEVTITPNTTERIFRAADGRVIRSGAKKALEALASSWAMDPLRLVHEKDKKKRKEFLLSVLPLTFEKNEVEAELGTATPIRGDLDLTGFDQFVDAVREKRKDQNKTVSNLEAILAENERALPPRDDMDWTAEAVRLSGLLNSERIDLDKAIATRRSQDALNGSQINSDETRQIQEIRAEADRKIAEVKRLAAQQRADLDRSSQSAIAEMHALHQPAIEEIVAKKSEADTHAQHQQQTEGVRRVIERTRERIRKETQGAELLDRQVKVLVRLRNKKLAALPIKGVEVYDTHIVVDGRDFDTQLSTSEQYEASMRICALAAGRLTVMVVDRAESMGDLLQDAIQRARRNGFQFFATKVVPGQPLRVERIGA